MTINSQWIGEIIRFLPPTRAADMIAKVPQGLGNNLADLLSASRDVQSARPWVHKLKGLAAAYGLDDVSAAARDIEAGQITEHDLPRALAELQALVGEAQKHLMGVASELRRSSNGCAN